MGNGSVLDFEENLIPLVGRERVEEMKAMRHKPVVLTHEWYVEKIAFYKATVEKLKKERGII